MLPLTLLLCAACADDATPAADLGTTPDTTTYPAKPRTSFGGKRPVNLDIPTSYDPTRAYPLVLVLHGYGASGWGQQRLLGYHDLVDKEGVLVAAPDGTVDSKGKPFWNATDVCCGATTNKPDDVAYLTALIKEIKAEVHVDPGRVFLIGHSNGGFMAFRMACDAADQVAAVISLAGATWKDASRCKPARPVSVVQIHGDKDDTVLYKGGVFSGGATYPGAVETVEQWAKHNGCKATRKTDPAQLDLDTMVTGKETQFQRHEACPAGVGVELWTMIGTGHVPFPTPLFTAQTWKFFNDHGRK